MESRSRWIPQKGVITAVAVCSMLAAAVAIPLTLYYQRGRKLPLRLVVSADRYVVGVGQSVTLTSRIFPADADVSLSWEGPGLSGQSSDHKPSGHKPSGQVSALGSRGPVIQWRAPTAAGVYDIRLSGRRSASRADDSISIQVLPKPPDSYPLSRPPMAAKPPTRPQKAAVCPPLKSARPSVRIVIHRREDPKAPLCRGEQVVVELVAAPSPGGPSSPRGVWLGSSEVSHKAGRMRAFRIPKRKGSIEIRALYRRRGDRCLVSLKRSLSIAACEVPGPEAALFADFVAQQSGPGVFRLAAKPPRGPLAIETRYTWQVDDQAAVSSLLPYLLIRTKVKRRDHLIRFEIRQGGRVLRTIGHVVDRMVP